VLSLPADAVGEALCFLSLRFGMASAGVYQPMPCRGAGFGLRDREAVALPFRAMPISEVPR
jgi:hypothetical protein